MKGFFFYENLRDGVYIDKVRIRGVSEMFILFLYRQRVKRMFGKKKKKNTNHHIYQVTKKKKNIKFTSTHRTYTAFITNHILE